MDNLGLYYERKYDYENAFKYYLNSYLSIDETKNPYAFNHLKRLLNDKK